MQARALFHRLVERVGKRVLRENDVLVQARALDWSRAIFREDAAEAEKEARVKMRERLYRIQEINEKVQKMQK